jgi:hypothetical protein
MNEILKTHIDGHVRITDNLGNVLLDKCNAIHPGNMAVAIARGLSNADNSQVFYLKLGNQGTYVDSNQQIVFRTPNTTGSTATLYNPTYSEVVDGASSSVGVGNSVTFTQISNTTNTRVIVTCIISADEAVSRSSDTSDSSTTVDSESDYFFDELGLFTYGASDSEQLMLSHLIFSPIEHTGNRELTLVYTLTISVS